THDQFMFQVRLVREQQLPRRIQEPFYTPDGDEAVMPDSDDEPVLLAPPKVIASTRRLTRSVRSTRSLSTSVLNTDVVPMSHAQVEAAPASVGVTTRSAAAQAASAEAATAAHGSTLAVLPSVDDGGMPPSALRL
ncbi:hypothetical protein LPJ62_007109, partial [Coemansia sp. RSA 2167]